MKLLQEAYTCLGHLEVLGVLWLAIDSQVQVATCASNELPQQPAVQLGITPRNLRLLKAPRSLAAVAVNGQAVPTLLGSAQVGAPFVVRRRVFAAPIQEYPG